MISTLYEVRHQRENLHLCCASHGDCACARCRLGGVGTLVCRVSEYPVQSNSLGLQLSHHAARGRASLYSRPRILDLMEL